MNSRQITGILLLVIGVILAVVGLAATDSAADRWSNFFTGHFTDRTVWYIIGGSLMCVAGLGLTLAGGRAVNA
jgi:uncharacterized membrane protein